jgi:hypothetical protein
MSNVVGRWRWIVLVGAVACDGREVASGYDAGSSFDGPLSVFPAPPDKVDLLFAIDNSGSMGDKQAYLNAAVPDLITRLVTPNCIEADGVTIDGPSSSDGMGTCPIGDTVEFPPVHDLHIGVVSSSLGNRGGDLCDPSGTSGSVSAHDDDRGELVNRGGAAELPVPDMTSSNFLAWFPATASNGGRDPAATPVVTVATSLESDFSDLVSGVHADGCPIESQLESWYRFLIQPDPYDSIVVTAGAAAWVGVDVTILQQRHDFLRPDSVVAIVDLTDENDSEIDARAVGQQGFNWLVGEFQPPRATQACLVNPADPDCTSCAIDSTDANCALGPYTNANDWGFNANLRHVHMKEKYGLDLQFPISRYVNGLTSGTVPDRDGEYPTNRTGATATNYVGNNDCTNPLYASTLPDGTAIDKASLCSLPTGTRPNDRVFYAHIGGVPHQLLHFTPNDDAASALTAADWTRILGNDSDHFDYSGIDPHMIESYAPRAGLSPPGSADDADPINGREWVTDSNPARGGTFVDLEYACTFPLATPRRCASGGGAESCDCPTTGAWGAEYTPPLCGGAGSLNPSVPQTTQIAAKAYPTTREAEVAKLMGAQGILASICPIHVNDNALGDDPLYGYRPAVAALIDRLRARLSGPCLPASITPSPNGSIPCTVVEALPNPDETCVEAGFVNADPEIARDFEDQIQESESPSVVNQPGQDISLNAICTVPALTEADRPSDFTSTNGSQTCKQGSDPGWCYVTGAAAGACPQTIVFTATGSPSGGVVEVLCH